MENGLPPQQPEVNKKLVTRKEGWTEFNNNNNNNNNNNIYIYYRVNLTAQVPIIKPAQKHKYNKDGNTKHKQTKYGSSRKKVI